MLSGPSYTLKDLGTCLGSRTYYPLQQLQCMRTNHEFCHYFLALSAILFTAVFFHTKSDVHWVQRAPGDRVRGVMSGTRCSQPPTWGSLPTNIDLET